MDGPAISPTSIRRRSDQGRSSSAATLAASPGSSWSTNKPGPARRFRSFKIRSFLPDMFALRTFSSRRAVVSGIRIASKSLPFVLLVFLLDPVAPAGIAAYGQTAEGGSLRSYQKARAILSRGLQAMGGVDEIRALGNVTVDYRGTRHMINQSRKAVGPWDKEPARGRFVVDRKGNRMFAETYTSYPGIGEFGGAWAIKGTEGYHWEPAKNHHGSEIIGKLSGSDTDGPWASAGRWLPPFMLLTAWDGGTNLRLLAPIQRGGRKLEALSVVQKDRSALTILFDAGTGEYRGFEVVRGDGVYGDATDTTLFSGYASIGKVRFPKRRSEYFNGELARELDLSFAVNTALQDGLFELPAGYSPAPAANAAERIKKIADGVYLDTTLGGIMVVEFKDFLAVVECPDDFWTSQGTVDAAKRAFPGKPIKFVVPSHTHGDHGGGARAFYHVGATLVTTPGHVEFYRRLAEMRPTVVTDPYSSSKMKPKIESFKGKKVITDGRQTLELYDVGPNAHSEEMTIAYLPRQRVLWQADVYFVPATGSGLNKAQPITIEFIKKLKSLGLTEFKWIVEAHHTRIVTIDDLRKSLAMANYTDF
jgi:glyoxylase-like metal-dependent hydrolase (beta-lactamase superfamily II)